MFTNTDKTITEYDAKQMYEDMLNECYPMAEICGYQYEPARALRLLDPIAYNVGFSDYCSELESEHGIIVE